ncbi:2-keto-4-pentenoate hydratase [gamma proteobacterium IMCC1989]|nr:2-keto-4-pentenoate hydratase [gamma proteobacterium IMCC1989]
MMNTITYMNTLLIPSKVVCVGRNYAKHIAELNNVNTGDMVIFIKSNNSITNTLYAYHQEPLHYEAELCFLVKNGELSGVGFGLDLTKRGLQSELKSKGLPWERAKSFDRSAVLSEFVALPAGIDGLSLELWINDELRQQGGVADMLFSPQVVLDDLKTFLTLESGDVLMTGTPEGVGVIHSGDQFVGRIFYDEEHEKKLLLEVSWLAQ